MICYKDKTFCPFWEKCNNGPTCDRAFTPQIYKDAKKWWGSFDKKGNPPIAYWTDKPECFEEHK